MNKKNPYFSCDPKQTTANSTYKEPTYKELTVIRNKFPFPKLYQRTSSL